MRMHPTLPSFKMYTIPNRLLWSTHLTTIGGVGGVLSLAETMAMERELSARSSSDCRVRRRHRTTSGPLPGTFSWYSRGLNSDSLSSLLESFLATFTTSVEVLAGFASPGFAASTFVGAGWLSFAAGSVLLRGTWPLSDRVVVPLVACSRPSKERAAPRGISLLIRIRAAELVCAVTVSFACTDCVACIVCAAFVTARSGLCWALCCAAKL